MGLKVYTDRLSQPSRAILIFCKINGIEFEENNVDLTTRQHLVPGYEEINPFRQVPAIVDGEFKLAESHAILRYLASAYPGVADHWYPSDVKERAKVESVLDWHHTNLRRGSVGYILNTTIAPLFGLELNPEAAAEAEKLLLSSLENLESVWLKGDGGFLLGNSQPSIADLSLVCEVMQLQLVEEKDRERILNPYKKVQMWVEATKQATNPQFEEIYEALFKLKAYLEKGRLQSKQ